MTSPVADDVVTEARAGGVAFTGTVTTARSGKATGTDDGTVVTGPPLEALALPEADAGVAALTMAVAGGLGEITGAHRAALGVAPVLLAVADAGQLVADAVP